MTKTFKIGKTVDEHAYKVILDYMFAALDHGHCMNAYKEARSAIDSLTFFNTDNTDLKELTAWAEYTMRKIANNEKVCSAVFGDDEGDDIDHAIRKAYMGALGSALNVYNSLVQLSDLIDEHENESEEN